MVARITADPAILVGKSCVKGTRVRVALTVDFARSGARRDYIVEAYPHLKPESVGARCSTPRSDGRATFTCPRP